MRTALVLLCCVLVVAAPAAAAQRCQAPPGTAAIEQYCETIPTASGDDANPHSGSPRSASTDTLREIAAGAGPGAVVAITGQDAPTEPAGSGRSHDPASNRQPQARPTRSETPAPQRGNPLNAVVSAAGTGAQVGGALLYSLLGVTLLVAGAAWLRFRRTHG